MTPNRTKTQIREELAGRWAETWPSPRPPDRPPVFPGAGQAAERLRRTPEYRQATVVAVMPDPSLVQVRVNLLNDNKTLLAATPGLKDGLVRLTPDMVTPPQRSRMLRGGSLLEAGRPLRPPKDKIKKVDMLVGAALAADAQGGVLGDGRGHLDVLYAVLRAMGAMGPRAGVAVLLDDLQIVDGLPQALWDVGASLLVTPTRVIRPEHPARPEPDLTTLPDKLASLPLVRAAKGEITP